LNAYLTKVNRNDSTLGFAGTPGFAAPELGVRVILMQKSSIASHGRNLTTKQGWIQG
jgi:hypothetical protein